MRIALDAMGSDRAPAIEVEGAVGALRSQTGDLRLVLVGDRASIEAELDRYPDAPRDRVEIVHAQQRIEAGEPPTQAIRRKRDSSIVVGLELLKQGRVQAFISAGSTGAVMAGSLMLLRPLPGVDRPAIGTVLPTRHGRILLLDAGANIDTRPHHLLQFAQLGTIYARDLMGIAEPRVGLLNIGEEPEKGDERALEAYRLLAGSSSLRFIGNIEGRDIIEDRCDVVVCDGFVGNVLLKASEGVATMIVSFLRQEFTRNPWRMLAAWMAKPVRNALRARMDPGKYNGASLLGLKGIVIKSHGSADVYAFGQALERAVEEVKNNVPQRIAARMAQLPAAVQ
jgi:phosphate acyltransferase